MAEANYAEAVAQQDVISELLGKCFAARTVCEQKDIFEIPFLRSFIPEGRTSFLILASPLFRGLMKAILLLAPSSDNLQMLKHSCRF